MTNITSFNKTKYLYFKTYPHLHQLLNLVFYLVNHHTFQSSPYIFFVLEKTVVPVPFSPSVSHTVVGVPYPCPPIGAGYKSCVSFHFECVSWSPPVAKILDVGVLKNSCLVACLSKYLVEYLIDIFGFLPFNQFWILALLVMMITGFQADMRVGISVIPNI